VRRVPPVLGQYCNGDSFLTAVRGCSHTPDENERRKQDRRAKAVYCKFLADREPDKQLRKYYTSLSAD
jgi:hypothetical protein